jgi:hypothetical protein
MSWQPPPIGGLRWIDAVLEERRWRCAFLPSADLQTAQQLLSPIPRGGSLQFLDLLYNGRPPADAIEPGAIFCDYHRWLGGLVVAPRKDRRELEPLGPERPLRCVTSTRRRSLHAGPARQSLSRST